MRGNQFHLFEFCRNTLRTTLSGLETEFDHDASSTDMLHLCTAPNDSPILSKGQLHVPSESDRFFTIIMYNPGGTLWLGTNSIDFSQYPIYNFVAMVDYWMREIVADLILGT